MMDPDHRLLLTSALRLVHSANPGVRLIEFNIVLTLTRIFKVILAITELYYYLAPYAEMSLIMRPLFHTLAHSREVQFIVLTSITSMVSKRASLFEPYMKNFYIRGSVCPYDSYT